MTEDAQAPPAGDGDAPPKVGRITFSGTAQVSVSLAELRVLTSAVNRLKREVTRLSREVRVLKVALPSGAGGLGGTHETPVSGQGATPHQCQVCGGMGAIMSRYPSTNATEPCTACGGTGLVWN